jgi:serine/threonine protein phosphatase PrpC
MFGLKPSSFRYRISKKNHPANHKAGPEGPIVPTIGVYSKCGKKRGYSEDRVVTSSLSAALGESRKVLSFSDILSMDPDHVDCEEILMVGVFDGHGGVGCVDYVSEHLHNRIAKAATSERRHFSGLASAVADGFKTCEDEFSEIAQKERDYSGCCAMVALIHENQLLVGWAGDCRAVLCDGVNAEQLTVDHRPTDPSENKRILENGGHLSNNRINGVLSPSRGFGDLDIRALNSEGVLISEPSVIFKDPVDEKKIRSNSIFLIMATDGIWDVLSNELACDIVRSALRSNGNNAELAATRLVEEASRITADDISVAVVVWKVVPWESYSGMTMRDSGYSDEGEKL